MRIWFDSSHVAGDFSQGSLVVGIGIEDEASGQTIFDEITFAVPPDFHTHNDLVAAALMTLVGRAHPVVRFNFPISSRCAELLTAHYNLEEVGPVDPTMRPRQRGRVLGLNFSGGADSLAAYVLLKHIGAEFKAITTDYGGPFERERIGYELVERDVTCATDFRVKKYDRAGRFNGAVPLLFADYAGLSGIATGHTFNQTPPLSIESLDHGQTPVFRSQERAFNAGGLDEIHIVRGLLNLGCLQILVVLAPDLIEPSLASAASPRTEKYFSKCMIVRWLCEQQGLPIPAFTEGLRFPREPHRFGQDFSQDVRALFFAKHYGVDLARRASPGIQHQDLSFLDDLTLGFFTKYNPNFITLIPDDIRDRYLDGLHECGIYPYDERDWRELSIVRAFIYRTRKNPDEVPSAPEYAASRS